MLNVILAILMLLPIPALALDGTAKFTPVSNADSYTLYNVVDGSPLVLSTGIASPLSFSIPDDVTEAAFVLTATNKAGESDYSDPVYWIRKSEVVVDFPDRPSTLTINIGL